MDEGTLNDLLECSVCLERLDTSSKVLPCQHTFCRKCLDEIILKHKELRCPECRVLITVKIEDLPPNVLLMRILEGMKRGDPKPQPGPKQNQHLQPYAKALYDFVSQESGDLQFKSGDLIVLKKRVDSHWYQGECGGKQGVFPLSYVQIITPLPSHHPQCKALYDFRMTKDEDEGCLAFTKGDIIHVLRRVDENWAEGRLDDKIGIFPLAFVELNSLAKTLMKVSNSSTQAGPSKTAPPTPPNDSTDETAPLIPTVESPTPKSNQTNTNGKSSSAPTSPPERPNTVNRGPKEKRYSLSNQQHTQKSPLNRHSSEILGMALPSVEPRQRLHHHHHQHLHQEMHLALPVCCTAIYPYKPQKADELELKKGELYTVTERCQDGWYKGVSNRTQKTGVFPGNYVVVTKSLVPSSTEEKTTKMQILQAPELPPRALSPHRTTPRPKTNDNKGVKERNKEKGTVSLMKRLTSMKRAKSPPPPSTYSMDNPVFEDNVMLVNPPVHIRSGSCPSQLLQSTTTSSTSSASLAAPNNINKHKVLATSSGSQRPIKHNSNNKERSSSNASVLSQNPNNCTRNNTSFGAGALLIQQQKHQKSNSLDGTTTTSSTNGGMNKVPIVGIVQERFRCIAPYPPNTEYELELYVNDIIIVHKKREDGWYRGTLQRTGKTGLFPASFVESL